MHHTPIPQRRHRLHPAHAWLQHIVASLACAILLLANRISQRIGARGDEGSETTEKAVLTAIGLGLALGLAAAITAAVQKYQGQIH